MASPFLVNSKLPALVAGLSLALPLPNAWAQNTLPRGVVAGPVAEGIAEYQLANGLKILLFPDQSKPSTTVNITYLVGSRHENYGESGMAHLLEHLMFKGSRKYQNIAQQMGQRGMQFNGTTDTDRTNYYESFAASDENLQWALGLEADRMVNSFIAKKDLDSEMTVVRNEYEAGENSPVGVMIKRMMGVAFDWHNAGKSAIGNRSDIENVKIDNLQKFYRQYYQPDNAVLLVAGKFDSDKTLAMIVKYFGGIAKPKRVLPQFWTVEPVQDGERSVTVRRSGSTQVIALGYKIPAALHADSQALDAVADMLSNSPNGRLHKLLVETGQAAQVFAFTKNGIDPGLLVVAAIVKPGQVVQPVQQALIAAMENFAAPSSEEVVRYQRGAALNFEKLMSNPQELALALSGPISVGDWRLLFKERDDIEQLTAEKIAAVTQRYFKRDNRIAVSFVPEEQLQRAEIPLAPSAAQVLAGYTPRAAVAQIEEFDSRPANIDARTKRIDIGDFKLALLPKNSRGAQVEVNLQLHWGDAQSLRGKTLLNSFTMSMLTRGSSKFTRQQLADESDKLKMSGSPFNFHTTRENLPAALRLACHILREPSFPESEFEQLKQQQKVALEQAQTDPQNLASQALDEYFNAWPAGDYRAHSSFAQQKQELDQLRLQDVQAFYQEFFGASNGELAIVGDFDPLQAEQVVRECFTSWPSKASYTPLLNQSADVPAVRKLINTPDKENAFYLAHLNLDLGRDDADFPALLLANHILGEGGMASRLAHRVRQKDGLSYGIGSQLHAGERDRAGSFNIFAIVAPQNVGKLELAIKEELQKALQDGFTKEELAQAKSGLLQQRKLRRTEDAALAIGWTSLMHMQHSYAYSHALDQQLQAASLQQVNQALREKLKLDKLSFFIAVDQNKMLTNATAGGGGK